MVTREETIIKSLDPDAATTNRDALSKTIYSRMFDWYDFHCRIERKCNYACLSFLSTYGSSIKPSLTASPGAILTSSLCVIIYWFQSMK